MHFLIPYITLPVEWNQLPASLCQPYFVHSPLNSPYLAHITSSLCARSLSPPQLLGTVSLTTSGARQHLTNLNSA